MGDLINRNYLWVFNGVKSFVIEPNFQINDVSKTYCPPRYRAHKIILLRFDYFESMFSENWQEGKQNEIPIRNVEPEIFDIMMEFIYKGRLLNWTEKIFRWLDQSCKFGTFKNLPGNYVRAILFKILLTI